MTEKKPENQKVGTSHNIEVFLDGIHYVGDVASDIHFYDTMLANMEKMVKFSMDLENGGTLIMGYAAVQRAVFIFHRNKSSDAKQPNDKVQP